jgi:Cu/Ag efflux protein CusF
MNLRIAQFRFSFALAMLITGATLMLAEGQAPAAAITAINSQSGLVTAKVNTTGQVFQFRLNDSAQLKSLKAGQPIYANLTTRQVSLDGRTIAGTITSTASPALGVKGAGLTAQGGTPLRANVGSGNSGLQPPPRMAATKQIDPCSIPPADPADVLQALLSLGMKSYFPKAMQNGGEHIKLSDPQVEQVTCPNMTMKMKFAIEYRQTRGFPQFQVSGTVEMQSPLIGEVQYQPGSGGSTTVTQLNFLRATAVLTHIEITALHLENVPNWLDNAWLRDCLNGQHSNWGCQDVIHQMKFDISNLVQLYLQQGHAL